jgi:multicomponent Na+:H+ antiporter subunit E
VSVRLRLIPAASLAALWWLLSEGNAASWAVGLPAIALGLWLGRGSGRDDAPRLSFVGAGRFLFFFLRESMRGGMDVAGRVLAPRLRIEPGLAVYRTRLTGGPALLLFANSVSLLPGTVCADLEQDRLQLHLLDAAQDPEPELRRLEAAVARVFPDQGATDP